VSHHISVASLQSEVTNGGPIPCIYSTGLYGCLLTGGPENRCKPVGDTFRSGLDVHLLQRQISSNNTEIRNYYPYKGKVVPVHNLVPHSEDVLGEWKYSSMHS